MSQYRAKQPVCHIHIDASMKTLALRKYRSQLPRPASTASPPAAKSSSHGKTSETQRVAAMTIHRQHADDTLDTRSAKGPNAFGEISPKAGKLP
jgi:hypothetical protein